MLQLMLKQIAGLRISGVVGFYAANSQEDDILLYDPDCHGGNRRVIATMHGLRQQEEREDANYLCISDFVAPVASGCVDFVGMFAVTAGLGADELARRYWLVGGGGWLVTNGIQLPGRRGRLQQSHGEGAGRPIGRGVGGVPALDGAVLLVGLQCGRGPGARGTAQGHV